MIDDISRFLNFVNASSWSECWLWLGQKDSWDYGKFSRYDFKEFAHRSVLEMCTGKRINEGLTVDHLCRIPSCVNPTHLEIVTQNENNRRKNEFHKKSGTKGNWKTGTSAYSRQGTI